MQRKKMLIAVLAIALLVGTASAALLTYFGRITSTVTVSQSVRLDGLSMPESWAITESVSGVAGSQFHGDLHWLTNANPEIDAIVSLDSTITSGDPDGLTMTPKFRLDAVEGQDNDDLLVIVPTTTWADFVSVSFDYFVTGDSVYEMTPHINIALRDASTGAYKCIIVFNEKPATKGVWQTVTFIKSDPYWSDVTPNDAWVFNCFTIEVADGAGPITAAQVQTVWVKNPKLGDTPMYWFRVPNDTYGNVPARVVYFVMGYDFAMNAAAGTRTVVTYVTYRGTYTQGFVWTP